MTTEEIKAKEEHLKFSKERAFEILDKQQNPIEAWTSFLSDMSNNDATKDHPFLTVGMGLVMLGSLSTVPSMRKFIDDFN